MTKACRACAEHKPQFHSPAQAHLIKSTQPFERLNLDFKGPLKSNNQNTFFLNIVDEYSQFPFVRMLVHRLSHSACANSSLSMECQHMSTPTGVHCS